MFKTISKFWKPDTKLFQVIIELIFLLESPERKNYFNTKENDSMFEIFYDDEDAYLTTAIALSGAHDMDNQELLMYKLDERFTLDIMRQNRKYRKMIHEDMIFDHDDQIAGLKLDGGRVYHISSESSNSI